MRSKTLLAVFGALALVRVLFFREGFFINDEPAHYLLSRSIAENFPDFLDLSEYIKSDIGRGAYYSFFMKNGEIHASVDMGYPLLASPFYLIAGKIGVHFFNLIADLLICYIVYLFACELFDNRMGILAAVLYTFATPSVFYSSSTWHHTTTALFFLLAQYYFLIRGETRRDVVFFSMSAALTVMCTYYMVVPISFMILYRLFTRREHQLLLVASFLTFLLPVFWYNYSNFGSLLLGEYDIPTPVKAAFGKAEYSYQAGAKRILIGLFEEVISIDIAPHFYSFAQKAILQSSPVLVFGFIYAFLRRDADFRAIFIANLLLIFMIAYYDGDFGGWELNMRYALPVMPFLAISTAGLLWHFKVEIPFTSLVFLLTIMAVFQLFGPVSPYDSFYVLMKILSTFFAFIGLFAVFTKKRKIIQIIAIITIVFSAFVNINDASYGASYRATYNFIGSSIYPVKDVVLFPANKFGGIFIEDSKVLFYYEEKMNDLLTGNITVVMMNKNMNKNYRIPSRCRIMSVRKFDGNYKYLVFHRYHRNIVRKLEDDYIIVDLSCSH